MHGHHDVARAAEDEDDDGWRKGREGVDHMGSGQEEAVLGDEECGTVRLDTKYWTVLRCNDGHNRASSLHGCNRVVTPGRHDFAV